MKIAKRRLSLNDPIIGHQNATKQIKTLQFEPLLHAEPEKFDRKCDLFQYLDNDVWSVIITFLARPTALALCSKRFAMLVSTNRRGTLYINHSGLERVKIFALLNSMIVYKQILPLQWTKVNTLDICMNLNRQLDTVVMYVDFFAALQRIYPNLSHWKIRIQGMPQHEAYSVTCSMRKELIVAPSHVSIGLPKHCAHGHDSLCGIFDFRHVKHLTVCSGNMWFSAFNLHAGFAHMYSHFIRLKTLEITAADAAPNPSFSMPLYLAPQSVRTLAMKWELLLERTTLPGHLHLNQQLFDQLDRLVISGNPRVRVPLDISTTGSELQWLLRPRPGVTRPELVFNANDIFGCDVQPLYMAFVRGGVDALLKLGLDFRVVILRHQWREFTVHSITKMYALNISRLYIAKDICGDWKQIKFQMCAHKTYCLIDSAFKELEKQ